MGLSIHKRHVCAPSGTLSPSLSADWPVRIFYGLVTLYQGLFGVFVPSSIFYQALQDHEGAVLIISVFLMTGLLLVVDGAFAMVRYCTPVNCDRVQPLMRLFHRWRHLLFLPPVFCYYVTLVLVNTHLKAGVWTVIGYYVVLAVLGVMFCLRDGIISQKAAHRRGPHA